MKTHRLILCLVALGACGDDNNPAVIPDAPAHAPDATVRTPDAGPGAPDAKLAGPDASARDPDAAVRTPDASPGAPDAAPASPDAQEATPDAPEATPDAPEATPDAPEATPDAPEATADGGPTPDSPTSPGFAEGDTAFCLTLGADFSSGAAVLSSVALPSLTVTQNIRPGTASNDPVIRASGGKIYVVSRLDATVTILDAATFTVDRKIATGGTNTQDIAVTGNKAYIADFDSGDLQVWDLSSNSTSPATTIDLSSYDPDGAPNANSVAVVGNRAFVTLELLDENFAPRARGKVVVIDTTTDEIETDFDLGSSNPINFLVRSGDDLLIETAADFHGTSGCVETIHTDPPGLGSCVINNNDLVATVGGIAVSGATTYLTFAAPDFSSAALRSVNGTTVSGPLTPASELPGSIELAPTGVLVYADGSFGSGGIRVYDPTAGHEVTTDALNIGLAPTFADGIVCLPR